VPESSAFNIPHSPIAAFGSIVLLFAFLVAAYGAASGILGNTQHRRRLVTSSVYALYGFCGLMTLASALMIYAFVTHDYTIKYVTHYSDVSMPLWYKITAYWGGLDGSLMFWVAVLAGFAAVAVRANHARHRDMIGYVVAVVLLAELFFLGILIYNKNPFATFLTAPPIDGKGLNPLLQNYWMVIHPPSLYLGFVAATIPFAFGIAALASGRLDDQWLESVRSWMMICWFFLSFGLILGGRWAYEELGWGGYWAWDPVENAGLLPWFTASAFLHSIMIQKQRGMLKVWNVVLVIVTFFLTIFGTFMTRSGVVQSVHAFGEDNELALLFILFMAVIFIVPFGLLIYRLPRLRSSSTFESFISREYAFLVNNWILLACALFVLFATMFPTLSEAIDGERVTVGPEFFNKWMTPLGLLLLFLAGAAPLLAWRRTTRDRLYAQFLFPSALFVLTIGGLAIAMPQTRVRTSILSDKLELPVVLVTFGLVAFVFGCLVQEFYKGIKVRMRQTGSDPFTSLVGLTLAKRSKYGGYIIHMSVAIMFLGFAGKAFEVMEDRTISKPGETFQVDDYTFVYEELTSTADDHMREVGAWVSVYKNGHKLDKAFVPGEHELLKRVFPSKRDYIKHEQPTTEVAIAHTMREDVYLVLTGYDERTQLANFRIYVNPLINWVWLGFMMLMVGTAICLVPQSVVNSVNGRGGRGGREQGSDDASEDRPRPSRRGSEAALILLAALGLGLGLARPAAAQPAEHVDESGRPAAGHDVDEGVAHMFRPGSGTAEKLMKELVCLCGTCQRESILECRCGYAAAERQKVLNLLTGHDLSTEAGQKAAYDAVVEAFVAEYGGRHVLATPQSKASWMIPYAAIAGGLLLLFGVGRRLVRRGRTQAAQNTAAAGAGSAAGTRDDDEYAEMLDDELRDTD
jgi:cytochrome c-type biogenesis protein CcmF